METCLNRIYSEEEMTKMLTVTISIHTRGRMKQALIHWQLMNIILGVMFHSLTHNSIHVLLSHTSVCVLLTWLGFNYVLTIICWVIETDDY